MSFSQRMLNIKLSFTLFHSHPFKFYSFWTNYFNGYNLFGHTKISEIIENKSV